MRERRRLHDPPRRQRRPPGDEVLHAREHAAPRRQLALRHTPAVHELIFAKRVAGGAMLQDLPVVEHGGGRHPQRLEEPSLEKVTVASPARMLDDHPEHEVAHVAVLEPRARGKTQRVLARGVEELRGRVVLSSPARAQRLEILPERRQARRMGQEVAHRDALPRLGSARQIREDRLVELDLASLDEHHDRRCSELLADRRQLEDGVGPDRHVVLEVGHTVPLHLRDRPV